MASVPRVRLFSQAPSSPVRALFLCALASLHVVGCASARRSPIATTVAVAITVPGGGTPSAMQVAKIHDAMRRPIAEHGYEFAHSAETADYLLHVTFTPAAADAAGGHVVVSGLKPNPLKHSRTSAMDRSIAVSEAVMRNATFEMMSAP